MKFSVSTASLMHLPLSRVFSAIKAAGFDGVELAVNWEVALRGAGYIQELEARYQLPVLSVHPPMLPLPLWGDMRAKIVQSAQLAAALRSEVMTVHPPPALLMGDSLTQRYLQTLDACRQTLNGEVRLAIENPVTVRKGQVLRRFAFDDPRNLRRFAEEQELPVTFDTSHASFSPVGFWPTYQLFKDRLVNVHLSDVRPRRLVRPLRFLHTYVIQHQAPGTGTLPLGELLGQLRQKGYDGLITLEISPLAEFAPAGRLAVEALARSLKYCREYTKVIGHPVG